MPFAVRMIPKDFKWLFCFQIICTKLLFCWGKILWVPYFIVLEAQPWLLLDINYFWSRTEGQFLQGWTIQGGRQLVFCNKSWDLFLLKSIYYFSYVLWRLNSGYKSSSFEDPFNQMILPLKLFFKKFLKIYLYLKFTWIKNNGFLLFLSHFLSHPSLQRQFSLFA